MRKLTFLLVLMTIVAMSGCIRQTFIMGDKETTTTTLKQITTTSIVGKYSLFGYVTLIEGDCMPIICDRPPCGQITCKTSFVSRKINIRELTFIDDMSGVYLLSPKTKLIASTTSNENGYYSIQLGEGTYSIFVEDNGKEYCNSFGGNGESCKVELSRNTQYNISIDYAIY